jgi:lariat debranching enzyme
MDLLRNLRPDWWFSAHLHVRFVAEVVHDSPSSVANPDEINIEDDDEAPAKPLVNPDEITLDDEEEQVAPLPPPRLKTRFLALDKCLPRRQFLEVSGIVENDAFRYPASCRLLTLVHRRRRNK